MGSPERAVAEGDHLGSELQRRALLSRIHKLEREGNIDAGTLAQVDKFVDRAEGLADRGKSSAASAQLHALSMQLKGNADFDELRGGLDDLSDAL